MTTRTFESVATVRFSAIWYFPSPVASSSPEHWRVVTTKMSITTRCCRRSGAAPISS